MDMVDFIPKELYVLVIALWIIGYMIKNTKLLKDAYIPFILLVFSIIAVFIDAGISMTSFMQAIICSAVAVYGKNILKQAAELLTPSKDSLPEEPLIKNNDLK